MIRKARRTYPHDGLMSLRVVQKVGEVALLTPHAKIVAIIAADRVKNAWLACGDIAQAATLRYNIMGIGSEISNHRSLTARGPPLPEIGSTLPFVRS